MNKFATAPRPCFRLPGSGSPDDHLAPATEAISTSSGKQCWLQRPATIMSAQDEAASAKYDASMAASPAQPAKRHRTHASRSCLACRKRKTRCLLANTAVPSSLAPLASEDACARCVSLGLECVVWDGDRKGTRYAYRDKDSQQRQARPKQHSGPQRQSGQQHGQNRQTSPPRSDGHPNNEALLTPFYPLDPVFEPHSDTPLQAGNEDAGTPSVARASLEKMVLRTSDSRLFRILRRPMLMLHVLLARQNVFRVGVPGGQDDERQAAHWLASVVQRLCASSQTRQRLQTCDWGLLMQHVHLPRLLECIELYGRHGQRSAATSLLLCMMLYLCRAWQALGEDTNTNEDSMPRRLPQLIRMYARQVMVRAPRRVETAQALELLAVYMPHILDGSEEERRLADDDDDSTAGTSIMAIAIDIGGALASAATSDVTHDGADVRHVRALWASLACWQTALSLHEQSPSPPNRAALAQPLASWWADNDDDDYSSAAARAAGLTALQVRCETVLLTAEYEMENESLTRMVLSDEAFRTRQAATVGAYLEALRDVAAVRRTKLDGALGAVVHKAAMLAPLVRSLWLWLEMESKGMFESLLSKGLGNLHDRRLRSPHLKRQNGLPVHLIWQDPDWGQSVRELGSQRNGDMVEMLARFCQFGCLLDEHRRAVSASGAVHPSMLLLPMHYLCAFVLSAAKALLDTQTVLLWGRKHVHPDTDAHVALMHRLADVMAALDIVGFTTYSGTREQGVSQCSSAIVRVVADTMLAWQERRSLVLARHRLEEKARRESIAVSHSSALSDPAATKPFSSGHEAPFDISLPPVARLDDVPLFDSLFGGLMEIPEWSAMMESQLSFA
ncbi:hypothetical protein FA10DRAFT_52031 [Acaromyces ingoldii]|uniref:Zn(2)-C6 fungal-type domain-containing protein n=1 Tax=Acaromyces ingoldii TaxID=215250 RepID=A0A316Y9W8_9BASI|nr:hypothetical protein FA10DRAFT_52031 [Acaromyces ingoldii]PWN86507.1 hypothetical protein FA10DRAFT_52031 [Acaromyces ingoldii]